MSIYVGLDVSHKKTAISVVDDNGGEVWGGNADTHPEMIIKAIGRWIDDLDLIGLETGSLTPWLTRSLRTAGLPVGIMDARRASDALKGRPQKTDRTDARALAEMLQAGWYTEVFLKSEESHRYKALLSARDQLVRNKRTFFDQIRGMLRPFGIKLPARQGTKKFDEAVRAACRHDDLLYVCLNALLEALASIEMQILKLDKLVRVRVQTSKPCWHVTSVPCVGPITALAFVAAVEDPTRFRRSRDIGAYLGLTPRRYQSGERDVAGAISKKGDSMARHYLYEAANCLLTTWSGHSALKGWWRKLVKRIGAKKARVAVARKLACLMLRLWKDQTHYEGDYRQIA